MFFNRDESVVYQKNTTRTASGNSSVKQMLEAENWFGAGAPGFDIVLKVTVQVIDSVSSNETYRLEFKSSAASTMTSSTTHLTVNLDRSKTGVFYFALPFNDETPVKRYTRLDATLGGTTPSLKYSAELTTRNREVGTFTAPSRPT